MLNGGKNHFFCNIFEIAWAVLFEKFKINETKIHFKRDFVELCNTQFSKQLKMRKETAFNNKENSGCL